MSAINIVEKMAGRGEGQGPPGEVGESRSFTEKVTTADP